MDFNTLRAVVREGAGYLPKDVKDAAGKVILDALDGMEKVAEVLDEVVMDLADQRPSNSIYDDVRKDVGNPPDSFEDIVADFHEPEASPTQSGGSENYLVIAGVVEVVCTHLGIKSWQTVESRAALYARRPELLDTDFKYLNRELEEAGSTFRLRLV